MTNKFIQNISNNTTPLGKCKSAILAIYLAFLEASLNKVVDNLYIINLGEPAWSDGQAMLEAKCHHSCSLISTYSSVIFEEEEEIVLVGGTTSAGLVSVQSDHSKNVDDFKVTFCLKVLGSTLSRSKSTTSLEIPGVKVTYYFASLTSLFTFFWPMVRIRTLTNSLQRTTSLLRSDPMLGPATRTLS